MTEPPISHRRIDKLKAIAYDRGFTNEDAKQFGKLSKTATWEALLELYLVDGESLETATVDSVDKTSEPLDLQVVDSVDTNKAVSVDKTSEPLDLQTVDSVDTLDWTNDGSFPVCFTRQNSTFFDWVDFGQLIALVLASVGVFVLAMSMWRQINPLNLFPKIRINIQIGAEYGTHEQNL
ncbi:MAG: hypothetical protein P2A85_13990 [Microcoleus anatoxicus]|uniref:hypothetical protein n=1 Tax=Microcoleus anatoxicus TaxID=2705319 RepID=UPI00366A9E1B